jgi:hypothetical protein
LIDAWWKPETTEVLFAVGGRSVEAGAEAEMVAFCCQVSSGALFKINFSNLLIFINILNIFV